MSDWRPIDTASKEDGTAEFDGWGYTLPDGGEAVPNPEFRRLTDCYWGRRDSDWIKPREGWCCTGHDGWAWAAFLTHWMPVPEPPTP